MSLPACGEAANDTSAPDDFLGRADEVLAESRRLWVSLTDQRSSAASLAASNARLIAELRTASESLATTARHLLGESVVGWASVPQLTAKCERTGRLRLTDGHVALAKESLAKLAAQLAGRAPDERARIELAGYVAFDDHVWRYKDFVDRAERAFAELAP